MTLLQNALKTILKLNMHAKKCKNNSVATRHTTPVNTEQPGEM